jgi:hypothetical protein
MWDGKHPGGPRLVEGWINTDHIVLVERSGRDRMGTFGQVVAEPVAIVTLVNNTVATVTGPDAVSLFRHCIMHGPSELPPPRPRVSDMDDLAEGGMLPTEAEAVARDMAAFS